MSTWDLWGRLIELADIRTGKYNEGAHFTLSGHQVKGRGRMNSMSRQDY